MYNFKHFGDSTLDLKTNNFNEWGSKQCSSQQKKPSARPSFPYDYPSGEKAANPNWPTAIGKRLPGWVWYSARHHHHQHCCRQTWATVFALKITHTPLPLFPFCPPNFFQKPFVVTFPIQADTHTHTNLLYISTNFPRPPLNRPPPLKRNNHFTGRGKLEREGGLFWKTQDKMNNEKESSSSRFRGLVAFILGWHVPRPPRIFKPPVCLGSVRNWFAANKLQQS